MQTLTEYDEWSDSEDTKSDGTDKVYELMGQPRPQKSPAKPAQSPLERM